MTIDKQDNSSYASVIADLRAKRDKIDNTIKALESLSGLKLTFPSGEPPKFVPENEADDSATESGEIDDGTFLGMSIVDAAKKLLGMRQRKMGNPEIARELIAGGLVMHSADPVNTVGSILTRRFNKEGDVVKVARGTWGLKEWYPNQTFKTATKATPDVPDLATKSKLASSEPDPGLRIRKATEAVRDTFVNGGNRDE